MIIPITYFEIKACAWHSKGQLISKVKVISGVQFGAIFLRILEVILWVTLGDFSDNFEPILDDLNLDTAFTQRALGTE